MDFVEVLFDFGRIFCDTVIKFFSGFLWKPFYSVVLDQEVDMFLKMLFVKMVAMVAPSPFFVSRFLGDDIAIAYTYWLIAQDKVLAKWHRTELARLDPVFAFWERSYELCRRREEAEKQGIGPLDPNYPDIFDIRPLTKIE